MDTYPLDMAQQEDGTVYGPSVGRSRVRERGTSGHMPGRPLRPESAERVRAREGCCWLPGDGPHESLLDRAGKQAGSHARCPQSARGQVADRPSRAPNSPAWVGHRQSLRQVVRFPALVVVAGVPGHSAHASVLLTSMTVSAHAVAGYRGDKNAGRADVGNGLHGRGRRGGRSRRFLSFCSRERLCPCRLVCVKKISSCR